MDNLEREEFWNKLITLEGKDVSTEMEALKKTIQYPKYLYRYRTVNSNNLEALRTNMAYFSKASNYDDPFDTYFRINADELMTEFNAFYQDDKILSSAVDCLRLLSVEYPLSNFNENDKSMITPDELKRIRDEGFAENVISVMLSIRGILQDRIYSLCLSENGTNESLWLKYADRHKGFALMYDTEDKESLRCGKEEKCVECGIHKFGMTLYPVHYSNLPYDATSFAKSVFVHCLINQLDISDRSNIKSVAKILGVPEVNPWDSQCICLNKKDCHKYDEEWRFVAQCEMNPPVMIEWIPYGLILGLRTPQNERNLLINLARQAGIKHVYQSCVDTQNNLKTIEIFS